MLPTISQYYQKQAISESDIDTDATFWEIDQDEVVKARYSDSESNIERTRFVPSQMNRKNANFILVSKGNYRYMLPNWLKYHGDSAVIRRKLIEQNVEWYFDFIQQDRRIRLNNGSSYRIEGVSRGAVVLPPNDDYCGLKMKGCIEVTEIK